MVNKILLSKSGMNCFIQCPYKWKRCYIDGVKSEASFAMNRGTRIHNKIERFYKKQNIHENLDKINDVDLDKFIKFEYRRIKEMMRLNKLDKKYFYPVYQELKLSSQEIGLKGIVDAVYINPEDEKLIVIDWKTGKYYPDKFDDYRFELTVYAELLKYSNRVSREIGYIGIYFTDQDKLFFEELTQNHIDILHDKIKNIREKMEQYLLEDEYPKQENMYCKYCQFKSECGK